MEVISYLSSTSQACVMEEWKRYLHDTKGTRQGCPGSDATSPEALAPQHPTDCPEV